MINTKIKLITFFVAEDGETVQWAQTRAGANCGSDDQLFIENFRLKLKKTGENTRSARHDLNQILYEFTTEVTNRFKGLDLLNCVPEELRTEICNIVQEAENKTIPRKKKSKKAKWLSEALQTAEEWRSEKQAKEGKVNPIKCRVSKKS